MMDCTDRHYRYFARLLTRHTLLYSEMVTTPAILRGKNPERYLGFDPLEKPLVLQLGGDDPAALAECAQIAEETGYDEVNLNVGCPSDRVQGGNFGVCLMKQPERVAECVAAMRGRVSVPVTVKHRIGVDELDRYEDMARFVEIISATGCDRFSVHARKAWLKGLSPRENRTVPPLRYDDVYRLKRELPGLRIEINGGVLSLDAAEQHLQRVDGVMIGRAAYDNPYLLVEADRRLFGDDSPSLTRHEAVLAMEPYLEDWIARGVKAHHVTRHLLGLFNGIPGARAYRRYLSKRAPTAQSADVLRQALQHVPDEAARSVG